ncbi:hypothetical protein UFOVP225_16 [uncultured Caudovirales phage]|uniref:Uncharacterized protein n=1 Tax=uncultured Caudovirales phage TaxID=2100421 RepID=A0A6J7WMQ5_9CAUD|nr:hypothetical protein UFOVP113_29 [uncultured Caudovirales phage]CAB5219027.1 hypothetical protein UFOVP225_16 [uncultured Caudovirales phage]
MAQNFKNTAIQKLKSAQAPLTKELRAAAASAGWPGKLANSLTVRIDKSSIYADYPEKLSAEIEDLEYGNGTEPPKPVIRLFLDRQSQKLQDLFAEAALDHLISSEAFA